MKKTSFIASVLLICLVLTCCAPKVALRDELGEGPLTEETARAIIHSFNGATIPTFSEDEPLPYAAAMNFFRYSGFYDVNGELREELKIYQTDDQYHLPAAVVDEYLCSKFDVEVDHNAPGARFDKIQQRYTMSPDAPYDGKTEIDSVTEQEDGGNATETAKAANYFMTGNINSGNFIGYYQTFSSAQIRENLKNGHAVGIHAYPNDGSLGHAVTLIKFEWIDNQDTIRAPGFYSYCYYDSNINGYFSSTYDSLIDGSAIVYNQKNYAWTNTIVYDE